MENFLFDNISAESPSFFSFGFLSYFVECIIMMFGQESDSLFLNQQLHLHVTCWCPNPTCLHRSPLSHNPGMSDCVMNAS